MDLGRYDAALLIYEGLKEETPKDPTVLIGYAAALQNSGRDDEAISVYEKVLALEPDNLDAHINMLGLIGNRYPAVALQRLKALQAKVSDFNPALVGQVAFTQARLGRYDEALKSYGVLAGRDPHNAQHLLNMAIVADKAGLRERAISYYEQALEVDSVYSGGRVLDRDQVFDRLAQLR
jgi:tetratricopeptide (TPR) repeat protein